MKKILKWVLEPFKVFIGLFLALLGWCGGLKMVIGTIISCAILIGIGYLFGWVTDKYQQWYTKQFNDETEDENV